MSAAPPNSAPPPAQDSLCVFCGSSPGNDPAYIQLAGELGKAIAQRRWRLVYGGGQRGLMGAVANAALSNGGHAFGAIPSAMASSAPSRHPTQQAQSQSHAHADAPLAPGSSEGTGQTLLSNADIAQHPHMQTLLVQSMHERKAVMAKEAGRGFVALPGGYGTFEEVLEMITWSQLGIHNVPIVLPNILGFWTPLEQLVRSANQHGFITPQGLDLVYFVQPKEVQSQYAGNWAEATLASVEKMQQRLKGRQGWFDWNSSSDGAANGASGASTSTSDLSQQPTAIEVSKLTYSFQPHLSPSLTDINLRLPQSSRTLLIGANGAGKSTLLRLLAGKRLVSTSRDHTPVRVFGKDVFNSPPAGITYLGTEWAMNPVVRSDIRVEDFLNSVGGYRYKARRDRLLDLLDVDLEWHMHAISDGERRRVQLCMGLMTPWTVLLLDEVTVDLDVQVRSDLLDFLREETVTRGATIVYATHIFDGLHDFPTHVVHMRLGGILDEGAPAPDAHGAIAWPVAQSQSQSQNGTLLDLALGWLRADRTVRQEAEAATGRQRGSRRARGGHGAGEEGTDVETDSERFYTRYDYSQTVMR